ncbi:PQQ-binding-like beta-propeller repeat protein [Akkermansiaceae bacterium]|nr:PQQ-binding-like beta-propeller repeat protein [bacterium]MDB4457957.1 PQQ-binding-like beta-propeller repeat protein [Akkermansiaceae bacterium]MDB4485700.1 PQQ-binding-like beta-propeller repeat protein [bacterium]MDB4546165.1 PQQ-binding-like beta-propeller repeat protein [Akkermansiaceae bacterium]MDB4578351.1 PQQ-binding-like beta-propeller repeat protein [Akkermansiaceae bacterium]
MKTTTGLLAIGLTFLASCKEAPKTDAAPETPAAPEAAEEAAPAEQSTAAVTTEWGMWGNDGTRNMTGIAKDLPTEINPGELDDDTEAAVLTDAKNIKWAAKLGSQAYGNTVIAGGKVYVGTNNESPRDEKQKGDRGVLMAFDEKDGSFLWQLVIPKLGAGKVSDWEYVGLCSSPAIEGDRMWLVTNRGEVICLDVNGMANGNDGPYKDEAKYSAAEDGGTPIEVTDQSADILWIYDMREELGVFPHNVSSCSPVVVGDMIFTATSNGVDWSHTNIPNESAPSLVALDKNTGKLVGEEAAGVSERVLHASWSSPAHGKIGGKDAIVWGGGDGWVYAFDPTPVPDEEGFGILKELWRHNCNPKEYLEKDGKPIKYATYAGPSEVIGTVVISDGLVYTMIGQDPEHGDGVGQIICLGADGKTVWSSKEIGRSISTMSVADGLVYAAEYDGDIHCYDAKTGEQYWVHETQSRLWGSTLVADGKVWMGTEDGELHILKAGKEKKDLGLIEFPAPIYSSAVVANNVVYIATQTHIYAIGK